MEHINIEIQGKFNQYAVLTAEDGYCFYDTTEELNYLIQVFTPIIDIAELERTYVVVYGDADKLNRELEKERESAITEE